jgi:hypothetical protein
MRNILNYNKVGIITIGRHSINLNFGAILVPFAFQKYLDKLNIDNVIIDYKRDNIGKLRILKFNIKHFFVSFFRWCVYRAHYKNFMDFFKYHYRIIDDDGKPFTSEYFEKNQNIEYFDFGKIACVSDIIWNPDYLEKFDRAFFCDYKFSEDMIKIAYAPSISKYTCFSEKEEAMFIKLIKNFDYISVREEQTSEYITKLTNKLVPYLLDPVLLLDEEDYYPFISKRKKHNDFLLVYNCEKNDKLMLKKAKELAKLLKLEMIEISRFWENKRNHKVYTSLDVSDFLWFFCNAKFIVTNGFHGMCFSIIFKKYFYIFSRDGIDLKTKNLVNILEIEEVFVSEDKLLKPININYDKVYVNLNKERNKSKEFINVAIINSKKNKND